MKFVMFLLISAAMVGFNVLCQEVIDSQVSGTNLAANSGNAARPADINHDPRPTKKQGSFCACTGTRKAQRVCPCKMPNSLNPLSEEKKVLCLKKGIRTYFKCKNLKIVKNKEAKEISIPI